MVWVPAAQPPPMDLVQSAGETVYVPNGWWHAVLNVEESIAVTQNFCNTTNFPRVWMHTKKSRPRMALKWLARLRTVRCAPAPTRRAAARTLCLLPHQCCALRALRASS